MWPLPLMCGYCSCLCCLLHLFCCVCSCLFPCSVLLILVELVLFLLALQVLFLLALQLHHLHAQHCHHLLRARAVDARPLFCSTLQQPFLTSASIVGLVMLLLLPLLFGVILAASLACAATQRRFWSNLELQVVASFPFSRFVHGHLIAVN